MHRQHTILDNCNTARSEVLKVMMSTHRFIVDTVDLLHAPSTL